MSDDSKQQPATSSPQESALTAVKLREAQWIKLALTLIDTGCPATYFGEFLQSMQLSSDAMVQFFRDVVTATQPHHHDKETQKERFAAIRAKMVPLMLGAGKRLGDELVSLRQQSTTKGALALTARTREDNDDWGWTSSESGGKAKH